MIEVPVETVGEWLRATRNAVGMSTREMGEAIGVSHGTVSSWERGHGEPSVTQFIRWCDATRQRPDRMIEALSGLARLKGLEPLTFWSVADDIEFWSIVGASDFSPSETAR